MYLVLTLKVGYLGDCTFVLYCCTALGCVDTSRKAYTKAKEMAAWLMCAGHAHPWSALYCLLASNLACKKLPSANLMHAAIIAKQLMLQCA